MADIFVDTSGWGNVFVESEPYFRQATSILQECIDSGNQVITTNLVLAELSALLTSPMRIPRPHQIAMIDSIRLSSWVRIIHINEALDAAAFDLFRNRPDKSWSLVDCSSFVVMTDLKLTDALTTDRHFEQAGFVRLLK